MSNCFYYFVFGALLQVGGVSFVSATNSSSGYGPEISLETKNYVAGGYLLAENSSSRLNLTDPVDKNLVEILKRDGVDIRSSRECKDWTDVSLNVSRRAWSLNYEHAKKAVSDRIDLARPVLKDLLLAAKVSEGCLKACDEIMDGAKNMESWAIRLINSWSSFPPSGIFEGTYSEAGSYHVCVAIDDVDVIGGHAHHCSLSFRPLMPSREAFKPVVEPEPLELVYQFEDSSNGTGKKDAFTHYLEHAQYHHYLYYKLNTCWPIKCSPFDVRRVAKQMGLMNAFVTGPTKCFSRFEDDYQEHGSVEPSERKFEANETTMTTRKKLKLSTWDVNNGIFIAKPFFGTPQKLTALVLLSLTGFILLMTLIDLLFLRVPKLLKLYQSPKKNRGNQENVEMKDLQSNLMMPSSSKIKDMNQATGSQMHQVIEKIESRAEADDEPVATNKEDPTGKVSPKRSTFVSFVEDCSIITNVGQFCGVGQVQLKKDISCLNGIKCILLAWIVMIHTIMYNDWSEFSRTMEIEKSVKSLLAQPLFNASHLVDILFLNSGLLSAYTTFSACQGDMKKLNIVRYLVARWLKVTPQVLLVSLLYILIPHLSHGPHYHPYVGEYAENCVSNWWMSLLHIQAFVGKEKMCNFVTWWVSIDFFYHTIAIAFIWSLSSSGHFYGVWSLITLVASFTSYSSWRHYSLNLPPNTLPTMPQIGKMWSDMTLGFSWTPHAHAVPYFGGFYVGYLMAMKQDSIVRFLNTRRAAFGWTIAVVFLIVQGFSNYWWMLGHTKYSQLVSTIHNISLPILWTACICWTIVACHYGYGGALNSILSGSVFIMLGKASNMFYLSHFQVMFLFFGNTGILLEPTIIMMFYIIIGNLTIATMHGIWLCIVYEMPWLKFVGRLLG